MKVLFATCDTPDFLSACIWDGLQEVIGEENVYDFYGSPWLHPSPPDRQDAMIDIGCSRKGQRWNGECDFDLLVVHSCANRDRDLADVWRRGGDMLRQGGRIAYVEGWDSALHVCPPPGRTDAVFRKEIDPRVSYPYQCRYLSFAAPSRWIQPGVKGFDRPVDAFFSGNPQSCLPSQPVRWPMLARVFETKRLHNSIVRTFGQNWPDYLWTMRHSKVALCPTGADLTDAMRTFEAAACGAVPIFVGFPERVRDHWFDGFMCFRCEPSGVADALDEALNNDLTARRAALVDHTSKFHTTAARAKRLLETVL